MTSIPMDFIRAIPKTDLHVHLDGSLRIATLIELAREQKFVLPSFAEEGLRRLVFKDHYKNLGEYLQGFAYTTAVLQTPEALERAAYELAVDSFSEGVRYIEPRLAPQLHINEEMEMPGALLAVDRGLKRAVAEFNARPEIRSGEEPPYAYGIIVCAMRMFGKAHSQYYKHFLNVHAYSPARAAFGMASLELARAVVRIRDEHGVSVAGFDLAGQEDGYPAHDHIAAYSYAHSHFLNKTVHAGEAYGPESIFEAITHLHADRIGHGYYLFDTEKIHSAEIEDRQQYVRRLAEYIASRRITLEICLTSNLQTNPALTSIASHPLRRMLESKISTTLCTDNRLVSNTTVCNEIALAASELGLTAGQLRESAFQGFKRSFMPFTYLEKRQYVRRIIDYYDALEKRWQIQRAPDAENDMTDDADGEA
ncbi:MAG: adenosine deaminase family protein [Candidatus Sumerlaeota bacterium]|nr:adenosine deaminase family protein [Candidatus Sumerlaeota bacterium]